MAEGTAWRMSAAEPRLSKTYFKEIYYTEHPYQYYSSKRVVISIETKLINCKVLQMKFGSTQNAVAEAAVGDAWRRQRPGERLPPSLVSFLSSHL